MHSKMGNASVAAAGKPYTTRDKTAHEHEKIMEEDAFSLLLTIIYAK